MIFEARAGGGSRGNCTSVGATLPGGGETQFMILRLTTNETTSAASPSSSVLTRMRSPVV